MQLNPTKKYVLAFSFIFLLKITDAFLLQGACLELEREEESRNILHYERLSIEEKPDGILSELDTSTRSLNNTWLSNDPFSIANSYKLAFQNNYEEKISRFLAIKCIASLILGFGPSIPQIAIASAVGEYYGSNILGYFLTAATILTVEGITSWMIWELVDDTDKLIKKSKQNQDSSNFTFIRGIGIGIFSLTLGILSSAPDVYKSYKYNDIKTLALISLIYDSIPRTLGFYKLISSIKCTSDNESEEQAAIRSRGKELIDLSKVYFLRQCKERGIDNTSISLKSYDSCTKIYTYLSSRFQPNRSEEILLGYDRKSLPKKIFEYASLILPVASASFDMVLAYKGYSLLTHNQVLLSLMSTFSVLPTFIFSSYVITKASGSFFDKIHSHKTKFSSLSYFETFHPYMNRAFITASLVLGSSTSISGFYIISDNLEGTFLNPCKYLLAALGVASGMTFGTYTIYSSLVNFGEVKKKYSEKSCYVLNCLKKLDDIRDFIDTSKLDPVRAFTEDITSS